jgi:flagellar hook-associated protein 3 FlgL
MTRITNTMLVNNLRHNLTNNIFNLEKYQRQLSTGRKINKLSDDPAALVKSLRLRTNLVEGEQYLANIKEGINFMETTDSALNNLTSILHRIRELAVQAANGTNEDSAYQAMSDEIRELTEQLTLVANTTYGTKYIFGGTNVTQPPYNQITKDWVGNDRPLELEIGVGVTMTINLTNGEMEGFFVGDGTEPGIIQHLENLADSLANDAPADAAKSADQALGIIDQFVDKLLSARSTVGAKINRLELQGSRLESTKASFTGLLAQNEDADIAEVIMQLKMQESVYLASLAAGARIIQPSLVDFLK